MASWFCEQSAGASHSTAIPDGGHDPLTGEALNVIEQLNQTFTILVSLRAVERLIEMHPEANGFRLALATSSGRDIESVEPDLVAGEEPIQAAIRNSRRTLPGWHRTQPAIATCSSRHRSTRLADKRT